MTSVCAQVVAIFRVSKKQGRIITGLDIRLNGTPQMNGNNDCNNNSKKRRRENLWIVILSLELTIRLKLSKRSSKSDIVYKHTHFMHNMMIASCNWLFSMAWLVLRLKCCDLWFMIKYTFFYCFFSCLFFFVDAIRVTSLIIELNLLAEGERAN